MIRTRNFRALLFYAALGLKGLDGILELLAGSTLLSVGPSFIVRVVRLLTQDEITEDPRDLLANYLRRIAGHLSLSSEHFMAVYLLLHGIVKIVLVWALLRRKVAVYPVSIFVFSALVCYQIYRFSITHGIALLVLTGIDLVVISLIWLEYRELRRQHT